MARVGYDPKNGKLKTEVAHLTVDRAFIYHFQVLAAAAVATSTTGVHALMNLGAAAQEITAGITNPAWPRNIAIVGNVSGIDGKVTIHGTNFKGDVISEELTANGTTTVVGAKAFKTVTKIDLPIQDHTPVKQVETVQVTAGASAAGDLVVRVTAAGMTNSPKDVTVPVTTDDDTAAEVAAKIRTALAADVDVSAFFTVGGTSDNVILTAKLEAANDGTLAIALQDADSSGVTFGASGNTTAGVVHDKISVGWGDKLGIPYMLPCNTIIVGKTALNNTLEGTEPTVTVDADEIEKNTIDLNSALDGSQVDAYFLV